MIKTVWDPKYGKGGWRVYCPACQEDHTFEKGRWELSGPEDSPTFTPSMKITVNPTTSKHYQPGHATTICHSFVRGGNWDYLSDCTHAMAGKIVPIADRAMQEGRPHGRVT